MSVNIEIEDISMLSFYQLQTKIDALFIAKSSLQNTDEYYENKANNLNDRINKIQVEQEKLVTVNYN